MKPSLPAVVGRVNGENRPPNKTLEDSRQAMGVAACLHGPRVARHEAFSP
jgi:hypothetical protein